MPATPKQPPAAREQTLLNQGLREFAKLLLALINLANEHPLLTMLILVIIQAVVAKAFEFVATDCGTFFCNDLPVCGINTLPLDDRNSIFCNKQEPVTDLLHLQSPPTGCKSTFPYRDFILGPDAKPCFTLFHQSPTTGQLEELGTACGEELRENGWS